MNIGDSVRVVKYEIGPDDDEVAGLEGEIVAFAPHYIDVYLPDAPNGMTNMLFTRDEIEVI